MGGLLGSVIEELGADEIFAVGCEEANFNELVSRVVGVRVAIQIGLSGEAVDRCVDDWVSAITDVTAAAHEIGAAVQRREFELATSLLPQERPYPLPGEIAARLGTSQGDTDD